MRKISIISLMQKLKWGGIGIQTGYFFPNNLIQFVNVKFWTPAKITSQNLSVSSFNLLDYRGIASVNHDFYLWWTKSMLRILVLVMAK